MRIEIVPETESGGPHTSRTIMLDELSALLAAVGTDAPFALYERAVLNENVLSKRTDSTRRRSLRYLRELYVLDRESPLFRALTVLWAADSVARPLLALICALARDPLLRATAPSVLGLDPGESIRSGDLAEAVKDRYPGSYRVAVAAKVGRNAASSWTQSGHLLGRTTKVRVSPQGRPASLALALYVGHLAGAAGAALFETIYARAVDRTLSALHDEAFGAAQRGWIDFRQAGDVVEVTFRGLLREPERMAG